MPIQQILVGNTADQFWGAQAGKPDLLLLNASGTDSITVGPNGIQPYGQNGYVIAPLAAISVPASESWWAVTDATDEPALIFLPGGGNLSNSPIAIATAIVESGLALAIAAQISSAGISLIGAPQALYGGEVTPPPSGTNLVGASVGYNLYGGGESGELATVGTLDGYIGRPYGMQVQKIATFTEGTWPTSIRTDYLALVNAGIPLLLTVKPARSANNTYASDSQITVTGTTLGQEKTSLAAWITLYKNAYVAAGFPAASFKLTIYGEPEDSGTGFTAAQYIPYYNYFAPTIQAAGIKCCYDPGSGKGEAAQAAYWPGTINGGNDAHIDEAYVDYYGTDWPAVTLATIEGLADSINVPFGIAEFNATAKGTFTGVFYDGTPNSYLGYIISVMQARITGGKQNAWIIAYLGYNVAAIPLPQDNILSASDFKVPGLQALYDALASGSGSSPTIAAGASYKVPPINPTPGGNFALASGLSYDISVSLTAGAASTLPFATVQLNWLNQDSAHAQPVASQRWSVPMGASTGTGEVTIGAGPQRGQYLQVIITNKDSVTCTVNNVMINSTSRNIDRHDWYWDAAGSNLPAFNTDSIATIAAGGQQDGNSLGSVNAVSIPANGSKAYVFGLFSGQVWFRCSGNSGSNLSYVLKPVPTAVWGSAALINESPSGEFGVLMVLPRAPCVVEISNSDGSNPHNAFVEIIARD